MGQRNYLIEGVSTSGKTSVCHELRRRGYQAINGDTDLAYQGDPETGLPVSGSRSHWHHLWSVEKVRALVADSTGPVTFFCGGCRNYPVFVKLFDAVFVLEIDEQTLHDRLDRRGSDEFGAHGPERELVQQLHRERTGTPDGIVINAILPLSEVVDQILQLIGHADQLPGRQI